MGTTLERRPPAHDPLGVLAAFPYPLATAEIAAVMTPHLGEPDVPAVELALIAAVGAGRAARRPAGSGSLWALACAAAIRLPRRAAGGPTAA